jgi:methylated-DNA-[protein]-cysteine S-methyltransferase
MRYCRFEPGWVSVSWRDDRVAKVEFCARPRNSNDDKKLRKELETVLAGGPIPRGLRIDADKLPEFTKRALGACAGIKAGHVLTYSELAEAAGRPRASRAAGQVMAKNRFPLLVPCHRVVGSNRSLTGFGGGMGWKEWLLGREGWSFEGKGRTRKLARRGCGCCS